MTSSARSLILHVGLPKTGTSSLQRWFHQHRLELRASGLDYPDPLDQNEHKHGFVTPELRHTATSRTLQEILNRSQQPRILISNEGLSNHFHDFSGAALEAFRKMTSSYTVEVIVITRDKAAWLKSYHKQCVLNPNIDASDLWGTDLTVDEISNHYRVIRLLDTNRLLPDLRVGFGASHVHHVEYGDDNWVGKILQILGVDQLQNHALPQVNTSLPDWSIEWLRHVNSLYAEQQDRALWKHLLRVFLSINNSELVRSTERLGTGRHIAVDLETLAALEQRVVDSSEIKSSSQRADVRTFAGFVRRQARHGTITP